MTIEISDLFVMVKPWGLNHAGEILSELDKHGSRVKLAKIDKVDTSRISKHYSSLKNAAYYSSMVEDFAGKSAIIALYEGNIQEFDILKDKIRAKYSSEIEVNPNHQRNVLHVSGSREEFLHDVEVWQDYLK